MSSRRRGRRAAKRKFTKRRRRTPITIWTIIILALVALAVGLARTIG